MSTHYLINLHTDKIADVVSTQDSPPETVVTGHYVVRVSDDIVVKEPASLVDLLTKKYAGTLGAFGLFTQIAYDDMLAATGVDLVASHGVILGDKGFVGVYPLGTLQASVTPFTWGGPGVGPSQAIVVFEIFEYIDLDPLSGAFVRSYREIDADSGVLDCSLSFDGGLTFIPVVDKTLVSIPSSAQGADLVVKFGHTGVPYGRVFLGSWSVLF